MALSDFQWNNSIIIFVEAHNLESFASDSSSFELSSLDIAGCILEIDRCVTMVQRQGNFTDDDGGGGAPNQENLLQCKMLFLKLEETLLKGLPPMEKSYEGEYIFEIFGSASITRDTYETLTSFLNSVSEYVMGVSGTQSSAPTPKLDAFCSALSKVFTPHGVAAASSYRVHLSSSSGHGRTLHYWCFDSSLSMKELLQLGVRSIIVTSGTLSPLSSYAAELGVPFPVQLSNPHILPHPEKQIHVRVLENGVSVVVRELK
jgi:regulator of telomere elongation helicase 1